MKFKKNNCEDISKLYNITNILDEYYIIEKDGFKKYIYIYKIEPIPIINIKSVDKEKIYIKYLEFLKCIDIDFQIYIKTNEFDLYNCFDNKEFKKNSEIYNNQLKLLFKDREILKTEYYIVISLENNNILDFENSIFKLNELGCIVVRVKGYKNLKNFLYYEMNRVDEF